MPVDQGGMTLGPRIHEILVGLLDGWLPAGAVDPAASLVQWLLAIVGLLVGVIGAMLYTTLVERKVVGRIQDRYGPNRVGPAGLLQPLADMVKILVKEDITPARAHRWVFNLGAALMVPPAILVFAVIPFGRSAVGSDLSVGLLFFLAVSAAAAIPIFMSGWSSRNKYALLGAMRAAAQVVSYEVPKVLSAVGVVLLAGSLSMQSIVYSQGPIAAAARPDFPGVWFALLQPIGFLVFIIAAVAEIERSPFDIPEAESEIVAGYFIEYSGIKFGMFYLAIYIATLATSALGAILFLGGWQPPHPALAFVPGPVWLGLKMAAFVFLFVWLRGTLPRMRVDHLMGFAWKALVPLALANLLVTGLVGKLAYEARLAAPPGSLQSTPLFAFLGFALANILFAAVALGIGAWWRSSRSAPLAGLPAGSPEVAR